MIQELTSFITGMHGIPVINQTNYKQGEPNTTGNKLDAMDVDKDSHKRKKPQTPRTGHQKTRATANIE